MEKTIKGKTRFFASAAFIFAGVFVLAIPASAETYGSDPYGSDQDQSVQESQYGSDNGSSSYNNDDQGRYDRDRSQYGDQQADNNDQSYGSDRSYGTGQYGSHNAQDVNRRNTYGSSYSGSMSSDRDEQQSYGQNNKNSGMTESSRSYSSGSRTADLDRDEKGYVRHHHLMSGRAHTASADYDDERGSSFRARVHLKHHHVKARVHKASFLSDNDRDDLRPSSSSPHRMTRNAEQSRLVRERHPDRDDAGSSGQ